MGNSDPPTTSPTLLRLLAAPGNEEPWRVFVGRYRGFVLDACRRAGLRAGDDEEACALVFEGLVTALRNFAYDPAKRFRGYLRRAVKHSVAKVRRGHGRRPASFDPGDLDRLPAEDPLEALSGELEERVADDLERVHRTFEAVQREVEPHTWRAFYLTAVEGCPAAEAAERLGLKVAAVYLAKSRVAARVRARIADLSSRDEPRGGSS